LILKRRKDFLKNLPMQEQMRMATRHNQEQSGIPYRPFYFGHADKEALSGGDLLGRHGQPYGFPAREHVSHGDEKGKRLPPKPKSRAPPWHRK